MRKEISIRNSELEPLANVLDQLFIQRRDLYAKQLEDGRYLCIRKPLRIRHLLAHLRGTITLGAYVLDQDSQANFVVFDADDDSELAGLVELHRNLSLAEFPAYLEESRRGGHLWIFFSESIPGREARAFGRSLIQHHDLGGIELFPKQDQLCTGPGSLVRLPFGVHRRNGVRYGFVNPDGRPLAPTAREQIRLLAAPKTVPVDQLEIFQPETPPEVYAPLPEPHKSTEGSPSQRIKESVSVSDFVGRFVELSPSGRGQCPFHDDRHESFSVNADENYWHCFAGCGGGSIIDFWMRWQKCDFTTAVRQLAQMLL